MKLTPQQPGRPLVVKVLQEISELGLVDARLGKAQLPTVVSMINAAKLDERQLLLAASAHHSMLDAERDWLASRKHQACSSGLNRSGTEIYTSRYILL